MTSRSYKWQTDEKNKLIIRFLKHGWQPKYYRDFKCSLTACRNELIRLGYIKED